MKPVFFLAPAGRGQGLTTVALGLVVALDRRGVRVSFYKPISEEIGSESRRERSTHFLRATTTISPADPLPLAEATKLISDGRLDEKTTMANLERRNRKWRTGCHVALHSRETRQWPLGHR